MFLPGLVLVFFVFPLYLSLEIEDLRPRLLKTLPKEGVDS